MAADPADLVGPAASSMAGYLTPGQQRLLSAALNSNKLDPTSATAAPEDPLAFSAQDWTSSGDPFNGSLESLLYTSTSQGSSIELDDGDLSALLDDHDYSLGAPARGTDGAEIHTNGAEDDSLPSREVDIHEKRKSPGDGKEPQDPNAKRREGVEKVPKKPGRKPLTVEPTNKRKAQNRAAQRAFRERKEKHLVDLESKVEELEKASEAANNENGLLKAKIDRLQSELQEYKSKLSQDIGSLRRSNSNSGAATSLFPPNKETSPTTFNFDFPRFGSLPGGVFGNRNDTQWTLDTPTTHGTAQGASSGGARRDSRPTSISNNSIEQIPPELGTFYNSRSVRTGGGFGGGSSGRQPEARDALEQTLLGQEDSRSPEAVASPSRIFRFNSNSASTSSPSASSVSQHGNASSCGTSPEPTQHSPANGHKDITLDTIQEQGLQFSKGGNNGLHSGVTGEDKYQSKTAMLQSPTAPAGSNAPTSFDSAFMPNSSDWLAAPNGNQFDPTLFGDYRDSSVANFGDGDFTGGFFNDALPIADWGNSLTWPNVDSMTTGLTPMDHKPNPLEQADLAQAGVEVPSSNGAAVPPQGNMLSCDKLWNTLQQNQGFKDGSLDIDSLCTELRAKAKCTETGVAIDQKDVDAAIQRLPTKNPFGRMDMI